MDDDYRDYRGRGGNQIGTLLTGIVLGIAATLWANEDTRQKLKDKFSDMADKGKEKMHEGKKKLAGGLESARKKLDEEDKEDEA